MTDDNAKVVADILSSVGWDDDFDSNYEEVEDNHFYVIALDPGETTGLAIIRIDTEDNKKLPELIFLDQIPGGHYGFYDYFEPFYIGENAVVVSEWWVEHNVKGANREPLVIQGVEHALWDDRNIAQQAPDMKSLVPDEWLKEQNLWTPGKRHQMDALIHAIVFLRNDGHAGTIGALGEGDGEGDGETIAQPGEADGAQGDGTPGDDTARRDLAQYGRERVEGRTGYSMQEIEAPGEGTVEPKGKRKERDLGGAFLGYVSEEEGSTEVSLFDGKL